MTYRAKCPNCSHEFEVNPVYMIADKSNTAFKVVEKLKRWINKQQEYSLLICLNTRMVITKIKVIHIGTLDSGFMHPREVFAEALKQHAASIIIAHNHPSGEIKPSQEDRDTTSKIKQAGEMMGINLIDSLIIGKTGYYSFAEMGEL